MLIGGRIAWMCLSIGAQPKSGCTLRSPFFNLPSLHGGGKITPCPICCHSPMDLGVRSGSLGVNLLMELPAVCGSMGWLQHRAWDVRLVKTSRCFQLGSARACSKMGSFKL